jgi:lysozyme family protein
MKNNFDHCLEMLLSHEGGFVNHPKDPGGMTNLGVTRATYEQYLGAL